MNTAARSRSRSAARLAAVQALYQQEMEGTPVPRLLREFHERPWLMNPQAEWEAEQKVLLITIETEGDDAKLQSEGVLDEIRDCVIAYFNFSSERVCFNILEAALIRGGPLKA